MDILTLSMVITLIAFLWATQLSYMGISFGIRYAIIGLVATAVLFFFSGVLISVSVLLAITPIIAIVMLTIKKKVPAYESVMFCIFAYGVGMVLTIVYLTLATGMDIPTQIQAAISAQVSEIQPMLLQMQQTTGEGIYSPAHFTTMLSEAIYMSIPQFVSMYCLCGGLIIYRWTLKRAAKKGLDVLKNTEFKNLRLPRNAVLGLAIVVLFGIIISNIDFPNALLISGLLLFGDMIILQIQGLSVASYYLHRGGISKGLRIFILVLATIFLQWVLVFVGLFELLFGIRSRIANRKV